MSNSLAEAHLHYEKACAAGLRQGGSPALLKDALAAENISIRTEAPLGVLQVPLEQIGGMCEEGRQNSFSSGYLPVLKSNTEFASKWIELCRAHMEEGINTPVKAYEFMNRYYIQEGNKRVSVLKYFGADSVAADVIRIIPPVSAREEIRINYEYIDFFHLTGINYMYFRRPGSFSRLLRLIGKPFYARWTEDDRKDFSSVYTRFREEFDRRLGKRDYTDACQAFLRFLTLFDYSGLRDASMADFRQMMEKAEPDLQNEITESGAELQLDPAAEKGNFLQSLFPGLTPELKVGFLYNKTPSASGWAYGHETARKHLQDTFSGKISTLTYPDADVDNVSSVLDRAIGDGCNLIFATSPVFLMESVRKAVLHPEVRILNCALNKPQKAVRTYYARMYEVRFLMGAIAASISKNRKIGFVADYPIYGTIAGINAFALGAQMIDPKVKVYLTWSKIDGIDLDAFLWNNELSVICGRDTLVGSKQDGRYGLYRIENGQIWNLAMPVWNWAVFYEKIVRQILNGNWKSEESKDNGGICYYWGLSSDIVNIIYSRRLPSGTLKLVRTLRESIIHGTLSPFAGPLTAQDGRLIRGTYDELEPGEIINMNWLADNIDGSIPESSELITEARILTDFQGINTGENIL